MLENYWVDIPYIGKVLDKDKILRVAASFKQTLIDTALHYLKSVNKSITDEWILLNLIYKKGKLYTSYDEYKFTKLNKNIDYFDWCYRQAIENAILELDNSERSYHDFLAHKVISEVIGEPLVRVAEGRLKYELNTHVIFGNLSIVLKWGMSQELNRYELAKLMSLWVANYLKGNLPLPNKYGRPIKLQYPATFKELSGMLVYHEQEIECSYYEPLIYTRYREDSSYVDITNSEGISIYQDSFYLRDVAIQRAIRSLL